LPELGGRGEEIGAGCEQVFRDAARRDSGSGGLSTFFGYRHSGEPLRLAPFLRSESGRRALVLVAAAEVVDEHLLDRFVVGLEDVADGVAADEVADFFGQVLSVIAGALEGLGHEDDLEAGLTGDVFGILDVAKKDEVAEAVHLGIGAENVNSLADVAIRKSVADVGEHFFEDGGHVSKVASVFGIDTTSGGLRAVGKTEEKVADAFEADHELHAGKEFAGLCGLYFGDGGGNRAVDFHIERVELAFADAQGIQQSAGASGDALSGGAGGFLGQETGFDGATDDPPMGGFRREAFGASSTHESVSLARAETARDY